MKILNDYKEIKFNNRRSAVALGSFDGVHLGHQKLINSMIFESNKDDLMSIVFTFMPHPRKVFMADQIYKTLQNPQDNLELIGRLMPDVVLAYPFDLEIAKLSPADFIDTILIGQLHVKKIWVGYNYRFGHKAMGDTEFLINYLSGTDISVNIIDKVVCRDNGISTSRIKHNLLAGDIKMVNELLGYNYNLSGEVVYGNQIGQTIGYPTANVSVSDDVLIPQKGVYAVKAMVDNMIYAGVMNIGNRPTVGDKLALTIEVHLLDQKFDLYGKHMKVYPITKIRNEMKFSGLDKLKEQISLDSEFARKILFNLNSTIKYL